MGLVFSVVLLLATVAALVDIITRDEFEVKHLPKLVWVLLVVFLPLIGIILWLAIGREWNLPERAPRVRTATRTATVYSAQVVPRETRTTEEQLADLDREIEYYKKRAELETLKKQQAEEPDAG